MTEKFTIYKVENGFMICETTGGGMGSGAGYYPRTWVAISKEQAAGILEMLLSLPEKYTAKSGAV